MTGGSRGIKSSSRGGVDMRVSKRCKGGSVGNILWSS